MARKKGATNGAGYERMKESARARNAELSAKGRDIGELPPVADPARKESCRFDFRRYCETYYPHTFTLPWSEDHLKVIKKIENAVLRGGLFAVAMPRASGKTSLVEAAASWAVLYGHRCFVVIIGASADAAVLILDSIKSEVECNTLLAADFPEVCYPVERLDRIVNRSKGQTYQGEPTYIVWTTGKVVFPTIPGSMASGAVIRTVGIEGSIRGIKHKRADGTSIRPDFIIPDDVQSDESAWSEAECAKRERKLVGGVLGLAGPGRKMSGVMPLTVVAPGDLADRFLDRKAHPEWAGERTQLLYEFPERIDLWGKYTEIRKDSLEEGRQGEEATEFYRANREEMDRGARVAWTQRFNEDELSALQHAFNLKADMGDDAWFSECQNAPRPKVRAQAGDLVADEIASRVNGLPRKVAPQWAKHLTAFIDVQQDLLYFVVCAWGEGFDGCLIDLGSWPDQKRAYFTLSQARPTIAQETKIGTLEGSLWAAMGKLTDQLLSSEWKADGGGVLRIERCLVDFNWGQSSELVKRFCRQSKHSAVLMPSKGVGIGASGLPMAEWPRRPGERRGAGWLCPAPQPGQVRFVLFDANAWKSTAASRLRQPLGEKGAFTLYGDKPEQHRMFAAHCTAEYRVQTSGRNRDLEEWKWRPGRPDNHLWDGFIGCMIAASMLGVAAAGAEEKPQAKKRVSYREMQARAKAAR